jgi:uncharacterized membrane protein
MFKHRPWLIVTLLTGFALRLTLLGEQSLWYDEGVTWLLSQMQTLGDLIAWTAADIQPPLYYLLIWGGDRIFGPSEWALRWPSAIFNTLTIPLIYVLARHLWPGRTFQSAFFAWLAALIIALSPLMVYYSQEARMYTLLVLEATLSSFLFLKILHHQDSEQHRLHRKNFLLFFLFYILTATAALYTHYFAAFLLLAHAAFAGLVLWRRGWPRRLLRQILLMFGLTALLFGPWLPTLLARLGDDPSYWPGALKLNEAVRKILISFTVGETVFEQTGVWLALGYLLILVGGTLWTIFHWPKLKSFGSQDRLETLSFLLLWLLLPLVLILILSYQSPKFNPRYTLLAWPAFSLILAAALVTGLTPRPTSRFTLFASRLFVSLSLLFILTTSGFSLFNWFTDIRFSKDDFKALAQFVQERIKADETVLLSSGHLFPVWAYYYGWNNWTPLPQMPRLDVTRVTDLSIATDIAPAVDGKAGAWLVTWQDEVIDPNGAVPFWLDRIGRRPGDAGDFYGVGLEHWRLDPSRLELLFQSPIEQPAAINFANQVDLLGMTPLSDTDLTLFWRPRQPLPDNLILTLHLTDSEGFSWDREAMVTPLGSDTYPPARWPAGQTVVTRHRLAWQIGTPPGLYRLEIELGQAAPSGFTGWDILDEQARPLRRTALLEPLMLSQLVRPETGPLSIEGDPLVDFFPIVAVRHSLVSPPSAEPGDRLLLALLWQAGRLNSDDISVAFELIDASGQPFRVGSAPTPSRNFNLPLWKPGDLVLGQYWLDIPPNSTAGPARLWLHLINPGTGPYKKIFPLDQVDIRATRRSFEPPAQVDLPLEADFSGQATLIGADCSTWTGTECRAGPGESITVTFYWQATGPLAKNYTVFTHLLDTEEQVIVNADHAPAKPTQGWVAGEIITDPVRLTLPSDLSPGEYALEVGLYDATDPAYTRLPLDTLENRIVVSPFLKVQ